MVHKIAVVGDKASIMPFKMIGFDTVFVRSAQEARQAVRRLEQEACGIIYLTEHLAQEMPETVAYYREKVMPALILIPNFKGTLNIGIKNIQENVEKAIGTNIL